MPDKYPVPNMTDLAVRLRGCQVFTKLVLKKGYYQIPVKPNNVPKTAVITPLGLWEFLRMPFGLRNAGQTFQRLMDMVGAGLTFVFIYLDDVLVANPDEPNTFGTCERFSRGCDNTATCSTSPSALSARQRLSSWDTGFQGEGRSLSSSAWRPFRPF
jgi:hypothetical protein